MKGIATAAGLALLILAAPAAAQDRDEALACALRTLSPGFSQAIAERFAAEGAEAEYDDLVNQDEMERVAIACLDLSAPDNREAEQLGERLMTYQLMKASEAALDAREGMSPAALYEAWAELSDADRATLRAITDGTAPNDQGMAIGEIMLRMTTALRPGFNLAADDAERLIGDVSVYAITRTALEGDAALAGN